MASKTSGGTVVESSMGTCARDQEKTSETSPLVAGTTISDLLGLVSWVSQGTPSWMSLCSWSSQTLRGQNMGFQWYMETAHETHETVVSGLSSLKESRHSF
eukprot:CAMPEP_0194491964 /NCGR_PEP_ID=MMETSP0253-20130528/10684_1 /TAXON_ID=2966 /ORGANISM="Noctiluca scintillans" /LENGTH=100 /DNA_ID=CAMNT_0039332767 /DNA_START=440 /DNA_END=742 /DNA_ORIENTATION=-